MVEKCVDENTLFVHPERVKRIVTDTEGLVENITKLQETRVPEERRKHPRIRVGCPAYVYPLDDHHAQLADPYVVVVKDISEGGIAVFFLSSRPFTYDFFRIEIPVGEVMMRAIGEVVERNRSDQFHELAGKFVLRLEDVPIT